MKYLICSKSDFSPVDFTGVRWLEQESDYPPAKQYWKAFDQDLDDITWSKAHEFGDRYAAFLEGGQIISIAAVCYLSDEAWEVAAVSTLKSYRRKGYSKRVLSFITAYILETGRLATCSTNEDNVAMIAAAKSIGFQEVPRDEAWWSS